MTNGVGMREGGREKGEVKGKEGNDRMSERKMADEPKYVQATAELLPLHIRTSAPRLVGDHLL
jgi:hypothetical protein